VISALLEAYIHPMQRIIDSSSESNIGWNNRRNFPGLAYGCLKKEQSLRSSLLAFSRRVWPGKRHYDPVLKRIGRAHDYTIFPIYPCQYLKCLSKISPEFDLTKFNLVFLIEARQFGALLLGTEPYSQETSQQFPFWPQQSEPVRSCLQEFRFLMQII
jgi:hypothetical protein